MFYDRCYNYRSFYVTVQVHNSLLSPPIIIPKGFSSLNILSPWYLLKRRLDIPLRRAPCLFRRLRIPALYLQLHVRLVDLAMLVCFYMIMN